MQYKAFIFLLIFILKPFIHKTQIFKYKYKMFH